MHQEHVVVPNALTHTLTSVIKKKKEKKRKEKRDEIYATVNVFKTNLLRVYQQQHITLYGWLDSKNTN